MPVLGQVQQNPVLTEVALMYGGGEFIADQLYPTLTVGEKAGRFLDVDTDQEAQRIDQLERAPNNRPVRFDFDLNDSKSYKTLERTIEAPIDDTVRAAYKSIIDMETAATRIGMAKLMRVRENLVVAGVTTAGNYATANKATLAGATQWSDYTNSVPDENIQTAIEAVALSSGKRANTFWCGRSVWTKLIRHPNIAGKAGGMLANTERQVLTPEIFGSLFGFSKVLIGDAIYVSTVRKQTITRAFLWGKFAGIAYVEPFPTVMSLTLGGRVCFEELQVGSYRDEVHKSDVVRIGEDCDYKFITGDCGYLWTSAVA